MYKTFGSTKEVFVNQDEGLFAAFPITLDSTVLTLETEVRQGRTYVLAGSVVKEGDTVCGILAEEYDITDGPMPARVVLEGYAWASSLTAGAIAAASALPKIIIMPYKAIVVRLEEVATGIAKLHIEGAKWSTSVATAHFTFTSNTLVANQVYLADDGDLMMQFTGTGIDSISAINSSAYVGVSGSAMKGLPLVITVAGTFVIANVGSYNSGTGVWTNGGASYVAVKDGDTYTVSGTIPYADADVTLGLLAGNRLQLKFVNTEIDSKDDLPSGNILTVSGKLVTNTYTKDAFEADGSLIFVGNAFVDADFVFKIKWTADVESVYTVKVNEATFATE